MYVWNGAELWNAAIFPKKAGEALKVATFTQLKVLFYLATCGQKGVDAAACAAALGGRVTEADCADALAFWEAEGVLTETGSQTAAVASPAAPVIEVPSVPAQPVETPVTAAAPPAPAVKTVTAAEVAAAKTEKTAKTRQDRKAFLELLHAVESRFGKTLSRADQDRLTTLFDETELPLEVLMMVIAFAVKSDKKRVSYIQTVAADWQERGIVTIDAADKHLCRLERCEKAWNKLVSWLTPEVTKPTVAQKELADKWIYEYKQKQPLVTLAYEKCLEKTGKFQAAYMDRMLTAWHEDGITSPDKVNAPAAKRTRSTAKKGEGGFDVEKYEKLVAERTPHYRKKG